MDKLSRTEQKILLQALGFAIRALCEKNYTHRQNHLKLMDDAIDNILSDKYDEKMRFPDAPE